MAKTTLKPGDVLRLHIGRRLLIATVNEVRDEEQKDEDEVGRDRVTRLALSFRVVDKDGRDLLLE